MAHPQIAIFARMAKGGDAPNRVIFGQDTKLSRTMHDIRYSEKRDEIYVANPFAQAVLTFRGSATGEEAPIRVIQGPRTRLTNPDMIAVDDVNEEMVITGANEILVFPLLANGDVAPKRMIQGGRDVGWYTSYPSGSVIDPVRNLIVADGGVYDAEGRRGGTRDSLLIFDRTAEGKVQPLRIIRGPNTGIKGIRQMDINPATGWIVVAQITSGSIAEPEGTFVGVWHVTDQGDVPPRWRIDGTPENGMKKPRGVALNPNHKELIVSDMRMNAVLTFHFPEIF